jgi:AAHS family 4-hydroxybenzoate transporter-like MFS transporter
LAGLGMVASSFYAAGAVMLTLGLTVSLPSSGVIALTALFYPTAMRSAGTGWVLALGRLGQVCSPLAIGAMLALAWTPGRILAVMAMAPLFGGLCVLLKCALAPGRAAMVVPAEAEKTA